MPFPPIKYYGSYFENYQTTIMNVPHRAVYNSWNGTMNGEPCPDYIREEDGQLTDWLQYVLTLIESGKTHLLVPDPDYVRIKNKPRLTEEEINKAIIAVDQVFDYEMAFSREVHNKKSGAETTPDFHRLDPLARRAVIEGLDLIKGKWEIWYDKAIERDKTNAHFDPAYDNDELWKA